MAKSSFELAAMLKSAPDIRGPQAFHYDWCAYDKVVEGMFHRKYGEFETFPPNATRIKSALFMCGNCGGTPDAEDLMILMAVAESTHSQRLRHMACAGLRLYLSDCSGNVDDSQKQHVSAILRHLDELTPKQDTP